MAAVAFDSLEYAHQLEAAGMPRAQAEVIAQGLTSMFVHNFDSLVTKDYLDARFAESNAKMDTRFSESNTRFERMEGKFNLVFWMLGLTMICVVVPEALKFLG